MYTDFSTRPITHTLIFSRVLVSVEEGKTSQFCNNKSIAISDLVRGAALGLNTFEKTFQCHNPSPEVPGQYAQLSLFTRGIGFNLGAGKESVLEYAPLVIKTRGRPHSLLKNDLIPFSVHMCTHLCLGAYPSFRTDDHPTSFVEDTPCIHRHCHFV